ncbi:hypothetical protein DV738_g1431, partial [Chaetothyriales sp. CBS 135597]
MDFLQGFKRLVGQDGPAQKVVTDADDDFADFAAASPSLDSIVASVAGDATAAALPSGTGIIGAGSSAAAPYTAWYRVWERTTLSDFYMEMFVIPFIFLALAVHFWGVSSNRRRARKWMAVHQPILESEFALVGFHRQPKITPIAGGGETGPKFLESCNALTGANLADDLIKEKSAYEFETYASGRQNIAFADFKILLKRRANPMTLLTEEVMGLFFDAIKPKAERLEAIIYPFDGNESKFVAPPVPGTAEIEKTTHRIGNSTYDAFVLAIVDKMEMRRFREERYDASLTFTKDHARLPDWATAMSESAEITDTVLTKDLVEAIKAADRLFEYLIITDQPVEKPAKLDEAGGSKKRIELSVKLPSDGNYAPILPLFQQFLRLPDLLVHSAHFRPEVSKKINRLREEEKAKLKKIHDKEAEEERLRQLDKVKKEERDRKMKGMSAEEQRKFLEREAEKNRKKQEKRLTRRG